ncbi:TPA: hypothetical protein ACPZ0I_002586 [Klebsiella michiganensis]
MSIKLGVNEGNYFSDSQIFKNEISGKSLDLIISAYKAAASIDKKFSYIGARDFSPEHIAAAHFYRTKKDVLESILCLMCVDMRDDMLDTIAERLNKDAPDMSLILRKTKKTI